MNDPNALPAGPEVAAFLNAADPPERIAEGQQLDALFRRVTGWQPRLWSGSMIGYGSYAYRYDSGHQGVSLATGFSPRRREISVYILPGYQDHGAILARLGRHRMGKSCLYIRRLADVDQAVLAELIAAGLRDLSAIWPVSPS